MIGSIIIEGFLLLVIVVCVGLFLREVAYAAIEMYRFSKLIDEELQQEAKDKLNQK